MIGVLLVLLSTLCPAFQNVALKIVVSPQEILGWFPWGGWVEPSPQHSILLFQMRTMVVVPTMLLLSQVVHRSTFRELRHTFTLTPPPAPISKLRYWATIWGAGCCVFFALILLFTAISFLTTGIAVTIFFIHPAITNVLVWIFLGDRLKKRRLAIMSLVLFGLILVTPHSGTAAGDNWVLGTVAALAAGCCFSGYTLLTQQVLSPRGLPAGMQPLHPFAFSLVMFINNWMLATLGLLLVHIQVNPDYWPMIWGVSSLGAIAAMVAYLLNNFGIQLIGAAKASLIAAMTPILTTLLAFLLLQEAIAPVQVMGIICVTFGVAGLSLGRD